MFNKYYQDELIYLRQLGREYAQAYPETAKLLADTGSDPDVERLLEGTAFLTGQLRQKLDDELPELTHALLEMFWPQLLRPIPSMAVVRFESTRANDREPRVIPRGTPVESVPVDGTRCRFHTAYDTTVPPVRITQVVVRAHAPVQLTITLRLNEGLTCATLPLTSLRLHCAGEAAIASALHCCLTRHAQGVLLVAGERRLALPPESLAQVGFAPKEALIGRPDSSFAGFSWLHEYFAFPQKFLFVDVLHLRPALQSLGAATEVTLVVPLARLPTNMPQVSEANLLLGCTPVVNEFPHGATPIRIEPERREYKVLPGGPEPGHLEISAVTVVTGLVQGAAKARTYQPLFHLQQMGQEGGGYQLHRRPAVIGTGSDSYLSLSGAQPDETISIETIATNRRLPFALGPGDINAPTDQCPSNVRFKNLAKPTAPVHPPLGTGMEWQLLAHLGLNYRSLARIDTLTSLLDLYDIRAQVDQQARQAHRRLVESLASLRTAGATRIAGGVPLRGVAIDLELKDDHFASEGDLHLFVTILDQLFAGYVGMNTFTQLTVRGATNGDVLRRPALLGRRRLL